MTGKEQPNSTPIPTPNGYTTMGELSTGSIILGSNGLPITVTDIYPQGKKEVFRITLSDGRITECGYNHLWKVRINKKECIKSLQEILSIGYKNNIIEIPAFVDETLTEVKYYIVDEIRVDRIEDCTCIKVDAEDELYLTNDYIITHNTFMTCYAATHIGERTLIIVPFSALKSQWAQDTLVDMFNVDPSRVINVVKPSDFVNVNADFVVITQAALASLNKKYDLEAMMKANKFGIKAIDEVQGFFHNTIRVDGCSNIANNWYLTGTFGRSGEEENRLFQEMFDDVKAFVEKQKKPTLFDPKPGNIYGLRNYQIITMVYTNSGLAKEDVASVSKSMQYMQRAGKWARMGLSVAAYTNLVIPPDGTMTPFLKTILKIAKMAEEKVKYGGMLILVGTLAAVEIVAQKCRELFPDKTVGTYHSKKSVEEKAKVKAESDIIVSTIASAGTGFDVKGLSKLIIAQPFKSWIST